MRYHTARSLVFASIVSLALAGCQTDGTFDFLSVKNEPPANAQPAAYNQPPSPDAPAVDQEPLAPPQAAEPEQVYYTPANNSPRGEVLRGNNASDDIKLGKKHYREQNYGLAEKHFRRAVEAAPQNAEAWMGLAASYDRLRRFDLADRAYGQALKILGPTPEVLNNQGYSFILRGDYKNARVKLAQAKAKDPNNKYVQNNIDLLEDSIRNAR